MIQAALSHVIEGLRAPRPTLRRVLDQRPGAEAVIGFSVVSYALSVALIILFGEPRPPTMPALTWHLAGLFGWVGQIAFSAAIAFGLGRMFGGKGNLRECFLGIAWLTFITFFIPPIWSNFFHATADGEAGGLTVLLAVAGAALGVYLLSAVVAEVHRFRSTWTVLGVMMGMTMGFALILVLMMPASQ